MTTTIRAPSSEVFVGGGEMGELMRALDWSRTPLGPASEWPQSLRSAFSILLASKAAIVLFWGRDLVALYNDAYRPALGSKHPWALGQPVREVFPEVWDVIKPLMEGVLRSGEAFWATDHPFFLERHGYTEETYFDVSYDPVRVEDGSVGGVFCIVSEKTGNVIGERRLRTLTELASRSLTVEGPGDALRVMGQTLAENPSDIPFALLYLINGSTARLASAVRLEPGTPASPELIALDAPDGGPERWPIARVLERGSSVVVSDLQGRFGSLPGGAWPESPNAAVVLAIHLPGHDAARAVLVLGVSPRKTLDDPSRKFFDLVAGQVAMALAGATAREEARRRAEALAELDRAKTAFFSNVSHEFRTPLTLLLAPLEELLASELVSGEARELLTVMRRNARRLLKLVNTLLDFSRIEAGRVAPQYTATDLSRYTSDLASVFRSAIEKAGLRLVVDCAADLEPVYVDRDMWEKIVLNLLSNAFKHTFSGEIAISLRPQGTQVVLTVRDTGVGIPAAELPHLFERFHRVKGARGRTQEGSGIGLALVKELVALHGGEAAVTSELEVGTTLRVVIPRGKDHLQPERVQPEAPASFVGPSGEIFLEEALHWLDATDSGLTPLPIALAGPAAGAGRYRPGQSILLADDNADMRQYVGRLLSSDFEVTMVANGLRALELAREQQPDLIISDVMMPQLDGFELLQALRNDPRTSSIPVILLSARAGEEARIEGLEAGADDYLIKPFSARELQARVASTLKLARLRRQAAEREALLRAEQVQVLESIGDGFIAMKPDFRFTYLNASWERMSGLSRDVALGRTFWEVFPQALGTPLEQRLREAMARRVPTQFENFWEPDGHWYEVECYPAPEGGIVIYYRDVTDRKRADALLRGANESLERKVAERTAELEHRAAELARSNAELERFSYVASHDLREPLRMVANYTQLLARRYRGRLDQDADAFIGFAVAGVERMDALIRGLIAFSRVRTGPRILERVPLLEVAQEARSNLAEAIEQSGGSIELDPLPVVRADRVQMVQLIQNLLSNALKFRRDGIAPRVRIEGKPLNDFMVEIRVTDNGIGIAAEHRERIFGIFQRLHNCEQYEGTGIGLAICQRIVEQHGGRIRAEPNPDGPGTCLAVTLRGGPET